MITEADNIHLLSMSLYTSFQFLSYLNSKKLHNLIENMYKNVEYN